MKALEICKKLGLKAILNYNDWKAEQCEGEDYNGETLSASTICTAITKIL